MNTLEITEYKPGTVVTQGRETFTLLERLETIPTKSQWSLARWKVEFPDRYGQPSGKEWYRGVVEVGVPNTNRAPDIIGDAFFEKLTAIRRAAYLESQQNGVDNAGEPRERQGRGRPEGEMNDLKAYNIFRNIVKGARPYDANKVREATEWLQAKPDLKFLEKYNNKFIEMGLDPLPNV